MKYYELHEACGINDNIIGEGGRMMDPELYPEGGWNEYSKQFEIQPTAPFYEQKEYFPPEPDHRVYDPKIPFEGEDLMSVISPTEILVSQRVKEVFDRFPLPPHVLGPMYIVHRDDVYTYWYYDFYYHNLEWIDYERTSFFNNSSITRLDPEEKREYFKVSDHQDLIAKRLSKDRDITRLFRSSADPVILRKDYPYAIVSFIGIVVGIGNLMINQELYEALNTAGCTNNFYFLEKSIVQGP